MEHPFQVIVAADLVGGIGYKNALPWPKLKEDMKHFRRVTRQVNKPRHQNVAIMGRNTYESLPVKFRPLPGMINIIVSSTLSISADEENKTTTYIVKSWQEALVCYDQLMERDVATTGFVIGGSHLFQRAILSPRCQQIYWTSIYSVFPSDVKLPWSQPDPSRFSLSPIDDIKMLEENGVFYQIRVYQKIHEEYRYLSLVKDLISLGNPVLDRTKVGTRCMFGKELRFSLQNGVVPFLGTKRVSTKSVLLELVWLIRGYTDTTWLSQRGCTIWDANTTREALDNIGFYNRAVGDLGPGYGFQWRHCGAKYIDCTTDYSGQGFDQIKHVLHLIKTKPTDRRMVVSAWNPVDIANMSLPPCHYAMEWYVDIETRELSAKVCQRSADVALGSPFNIASYACMVHLFAHLTGYKAGEIIISMGNTHVYENQIKPLQEQLSRTPLEFPTIKIRESIQDIDKLEVEDFIITNYKPHPAVKMPMAV